MHHGVSRTVGENSMLAVQYEFKNYAALLQLGEWFGLTIFY